MKLGLWVGLIAMLVVLPGCGCLEQITLHPTLTAADIASLSGATASVGMVFKFKSCCPTAAQKATAQKVQDMSLGWFTQLQNGTMELGKYNELTVQAQNLLQNVILVCEAKPKEPGEKMKIPRFGTKERTKEEYEKEMWTALEVFVTNHR